MAINTQKFLPLAKTSTAIVKSAGKQISSDNKFKGGALVKQKKTNIQKVSSNQKEEKKEQKYGAIVKNLITIDKFLKASSESEKKTFEKDRLDKEKERSQKKEKKLETKEKAKGFNLPTISLPKFDFLDSVKRYFLFTFLGWLFTNTQQFLPKLFKILDIIKPIVSVVEFVSKTLLNGFVSFIELGYNAYDKVRETIKNLGGEGAQKTFDELSKNLNTLITTTILVAGAIATLGERSKKPDGPDKPPKGPKGGTPRGPRRSPITGRPVPTTSGGRTAGRPDLRNPLRQKPQITGGGGRPAPRLPAAKGGSRFKGIPVKGAFLIGPLLDFGIRTLVFGESPGRAAAAAVGAGIGQGIGTFIGGLGATALGLGTMGLGAVVAPLIVAAGATIGGFVGDWIGTSLYDAIVSMKENKKIEKKQGGGKVSPKTKKGTPKRSIKVSPRKYPKIKPPTSQPGKDVGGEREIKKLYPDPNKKMTLDEFLRSSMGQGSYTYVQYEKDWEKKTRKPNPYKALTTTAKILKEIPLVGGIMGAAVDIALGQKPDKMVYQSIAFSISNLINGLANQKVSSSIGFLMGEIRGFSDGGTIPSRELNLNDGNMNTANLLAKVLEPTIGQKVNEAVQSIQKELQLRDSKKEQQEPGGGFGGDGGGGGPSVESIDMNGLSSEDVDALGRMIQAEAGNQSAAGKASVMNVILNRYRLAKSGRGYLPRGKTKDNVTIRDILYAPNQFSPIDDGKFDRTSSASGRTALAQAISAGGNDPEKLKKVLMEKYKLTEQDANYVVVSTAFSNPELRGSRPFNTREVTVGNHTFQESPYARLRTPGQKIDARVTEAPSLIIKGGPIKGGAIVTQRGDPDSEQTGSDIAVGNHKVGAPIQNPFSSLKITKVGFQGSGSGTTGRGFGRYVTGETIINGKKYEILLGHLDKSHVKVGDILESGDVIGTQGISGRATGPHVSTHINALDGGNPSKILSSVENVWTRGGVIQTKSMGRPTSQSQSKSLTEIQTQIRDMKPGDPPVSIPGVGKVIIKKNEKGTLIKEYYDSNNNKVDSRKFFETYSKKGSQKEQKSAGIQNMQGGGLIGKSKPNLPIPSRFASYENYGQKSLIAILPVETEVMIPVPMIGGGPMMFPSANLNIKDSNNAHSLSR